jgi:hypothetical protein
VKNIVGQTAINYPEMVVDNPDRYQAAELDDGDSYEIPVQVPNGHRLVVYRWGCYDANTNSAPSGLDVQLLDGATLFVELRIQLMSTVPTNQSPRIKPTLGDLNRTYSVGRAILAIQ